MIRVIYLVFILLFILSSSIHAEGDRIKVGIFPLEPINFIDFAGTAQGLHPSLLREIARLENWSLSFVPLSWAEGLEGLQSGKIDLLVSVTHTQERAEVMDYSSESAMQVWGQLFVRTDGHVEEVADLQNQRIGIMYRDINGRNFQQMAERLGVECSYTAYPNLTEVLAAVRDGRVVAGVSPQHFGLRHAGEYDLVPSSIQFSPFPIFYTTQKGKNRHLLRQIDFHLKRWKQDKESFYYQQLAQWLGGQNKQRSLIPKWLYFALTGVGALALLLLGSSMLFKRQVKKGATELLAKNRSLQDSEEKFTRAFRLSPDAVNINRFSDGRYIEINPGFTTLTGWTEAEVIGRSSLDLNIWQTAADRERLTQELREKGEVKDFQATFLRKNGQPIIGSMSAKLLTINDEDCILSITRDISERIRLQEEQEKLQQQIYHSQKLESLGVLAGGIAHDFNNILMAVLGHCELALRRLAHDSPAQKNIEEIKNSANKAAELANQMLAYSGKGKFVVEPLNLSRLVAEMQQMLAVSVSKKALLRYQLSEPLPSVEADATQLRQVVLNLAINASDAIGDNNGVIAISTGTLDCDQAYLQDAWIDEQLPAGRYLFLEVADTGSGMDKETVKRIFEPFFTTKFTGRGLGMAAVLGIVRGHHGTIKIYTEKGQGTTIKVLLPATAKPAVSKPAEPAAAVPQASGTVLLVDDDETVRSIGREMLEEFGYDVILAEDGRDALEKFRQTENVCFVLMDLTMPYMDGEQAFRELQRLNPKVKVIMSSGYNEQEVSQKFAGKGICGFLKKPYQLSALQAAIQNLPQ